MDKELKDFCDVFVNKYSHEKHGLVSFLHEVNHLNFNKLSRILFKENQIYYWSRPDKNIKFLAFNSLLNITENGSSRLPSSQEFLDSRIKFHYNNFGEYKQNNLPVFFGGLKFSPENGREPWEDFADSDWFIPETLFIYTDNKYFICENFLPEHFSEETLTERLEKTNKISELKIEAEASGKHNFEKISGDDTEEWEKLVNSALTEISESQYTKIVLSRKVELKTDTPPDMAEWMEILEEKYPRCYIFTYKKADSFFFGATPETLALVKNDVIEADALAGSIPRGKNEEEDKKLAESLLSDKKNCSEHRAVVDFIVNSFADFADNIVYPSKPVIRKLQNIQHLWTPVKGTFKGDAKIFMMLKSIHPTPAICGTPWNKALQGIINKENFNRGFFTGVTGWFNLHKEGEFAVGIRSALYKNKKLYAYAGCGIVEGSSPKEEHEETNLKLKPILNLTDYEEVS